MLVKCLEEVVSSRFYRGYSCCARSPDVLELWSRWCVAIDMLTTTTSVLDGKPVSRYLGVVTGEAIIGANVFRDLLASVRDIVGGRSATYERALAEAREVALAEMQQRAQELGGNAVIGVDLDYEVLGQNNGMLMVSCSGTAVVC
jgi:uncharacterized protein YbjQ (UPF0145 family)